MHREVVEFDEPLVVQCESVRTIPFGIIPLSEVDRYVLGSYGQNPQPLQDGPVQ